VVLMADDQRAPGFVCATPKNKSDVIRIGHGSGGKLTSQLINNSFLPKLGDTFCGQLEDSAVLNLSANARIAVSTDSYVITPYRFPGGNIGSLAVHGTINDLAVRGARPLFLTAAFIIQEGFPISELEMLVESLADACRDANVILAAADTKVVNRNACDNVFINTTGIGIIEIDTPPSVSGTKPGDSIVLSGEIGLHGMAVMCAREDLQFEHDLKSDSALLDKLCQAMLASHNIHSMRDITRGGLISVLCEIAEASNVGVEIDEALIPMHPQVAAACELLGLDPLYVACEGRLVATAASGADTLIADMKAHDVAVNACVIGKATTEHPGKVILRSRIGGRRFLDRLSGDQLPRIC
jgi:hydrogenase expression/formation protein HypE